MSVACPNGHQSETTDYCDQCGARMGGPPPPAPQPTSPPPAMTTDPLSPAAVMGTPAPANPVATQAAAGADQLCPVCQAPRVGDDRFCESCGYDFSSPAPTGGQAVAVLAASAGTSSTPIWEAEVTADREYYERMAADGVVFPLHCPPRRFLLAGPEIRIGRHSSSRGIQPEVDLSGAPEDSAISHLHCLLIEQPDGSYSVLDPGSTNGTTLNDDTTPLVANTAVAVTDGDRIHLGAWTTITLHRRPAASP